MGMIEHKVIAGTRNGVTAKERADRIYQALDLQRGREEIEGFEIERLFNPSAREKLADTGNYSDEAIERILAKIPEGVFLVEIDY